MTGPPATAQWPSGRDLQRVGETKLGSSPRRVREVFEQVADALSQAGTELRTYAAEHEEFREVAERMLAEWEVGRKWLSH